MLGFKILSTLGLKYTNRIRYPALTPSNYYPDPFITDLYFRDI